MRIQRTRLLKWFSVAIPLVGVLVLAQGQARADEVTISGSTTGLVIGVPQLTFVGNANFTNTTALGSGALSGPNSLGTFFLNTAPTQFVAGTFTLNMTFTSPTNFQGAIRTATIIGTVSPNVNQGGVNINFDNTPLVFTFNIGGTAPGAVNGTWSVTLADLFVETGQSAALTAGTTGQQTTIPETTIPEPATLILFGTGLTGIAAKVRQRRKRPKKA